MLAELALEESAVHRDTLYTRRSDDVGRSGVNPARETLHAAAHGVPGKP